MDAECVGRGRAGGETESLGYCGGGVGDERSAKCAFAEGAIGFVRAIGERFGCYWEALALPEAEGERIWETDHDQSGIDAKSGAKPHTPTSALKS